MSLFRRKDSLRKLKRDLRARRPDPRTEFAQGLARLLQAEATAVRRPSWRLRAGVAFALTAGLVVVMGAFGGYSYAQSAVTSGATSTVRSVKSLVRAEPANTSATGTSAESNFTAALLTYDPPGLTINLVPPTFNIGGTLWIATATPSFTGSCDSNALNSPSPVSFTGSGSTGLTSQICASSSYTTGATSTLPQNVLLTTTAHQNDEGDPEVTASVSFKVDATNPTVSVTQGTACPNGTNGWCNALDPATITINVSGSDAGSGVTNLTCTDSIAPTNPTVTGQTGSNPRTGSFTVSAAGVHNISCTSTDGVGRTSAAGTLTVKIDRTAPTLSGVACVFNNPNRTARATGSSSDANTPNGTPPTMTYSSTSSDGGVALTWSSSTVTFSSGTTWNFDSGASSLGTNNRQYTVTVTSKDPAGNSTSASPASCSIATL